MIKDQINSKRILCFNIINNKKCEYGNKCMFAHSLNEQKINPMRHKVYTIIQSDTDLCDIDLVNDSKLFETMILMTKVCNLCNKNICHGGFNCKNGVMNIKYKICYDDIYYGNCRKKECQSIHLTKRGLCPFIKQKNQNNNKKNNPKQNYTLYEFSNNNTIDKNQLLSYLYNKPSYNSSDSETEDDIKNIINYLNDDNIDIGDMYKY